MKPQREEPDWGGIPIYNSTAQPVKPQAQRPDIQPPRPVQPKVASATPQAAQYQDHQIFQSQNYPDHPHPQSNYASTFQQQPTPDVSPKNGKRKKLFAGIALVAVLIFLGGGSAAAYYGYVLPNKPENVLLAAMAKTFDGATLQSYRIDGAAEISGSDIPKELHGISFSGEVSGTDALSGSVTLETAVAQPKLQFLTPDGKYLYIKLSGVSGFEDLIQMGAAGTPYEELATKFAPTLEEVNDSWYTLDSSLYTNNENNLSKSLSEIVDTDFKKLAETYQQHTFLRVVETLPDQDINNASAKHYKLEIQKNELLDFIRANKDVSIGDTSLSDDDFAELESEISKIDFSKYPIEVWIDKKTKFLTQIQTSITEAGTTLTARVTLKDFNAAITIQKPENAKSLLELYGEVSPLLMGTNTVEPDYEESARDLAEIQKLLEKYYDTYGSYPAEKDFADGLWRLKNMPAIDYDYSILFVDTATNNNDINQANGYKYDTNNNQNGCISAVDSSGYTVAGGNVCTQYLLTAQAPVDGEFNDYTKSNLQ